MDLLRFVTAGSVDDGKSTLIGRLLHDSHAILEDQLQAIRDASARRGDEYLNLALLTDGLRAEREQNITIDVAYRYFTTGRRKFIIADCPGHIQYTRNMVTGASTANLALILVDARKGLLEQTRRHCFVASLLRIPHIVICVNKMDLVDYSQEAHERVREEFAAFSKKLEVYDVSFIPISALNGDNVVQRSQRMPWYHGHSVLEHLEEVHVASDINWIDFRLPVQAVIRPQSREITDYRGYAGSIASGSVRVGEEVVALPSGMESRVTHVELSGEEVDSASAPHSVVLRLADDIDVTRGDMLVRKNNQPAPRQDLEATVCWLDRSKLTAGKRYVIRHTTREATAIVREIIYKFDINTLSRIPDDHAVALNDFARLRIHTSRPLLVDPYRVNRATGCFILIDESTGATAAAGMIL